MNDEIILVISVNNKEYRLETKVSPKESFLGAFESLVATCRKDLFKQIIDDLRNQSK